MTNSIQSIALDYPRAALVRDVSDAEREAYERDGAAIVKGILPDEWIDFMRAAVTRLLDRSDPSSQNYADDGQPRFFSQTFPWFFDDAFKAWALYGPLPEVAHQAMPTARYLNFFYDQIFAKEPGDTKATPWHQDFPFLPLKGNQILRIWVPFDSVSADGGAIHYLRGSHKWAPVYHPIGFKNISAITDTYVDSPYEDWPDFEADYDKYDWLVAEAEPGDLLLHHPMTIHGSLGNQTSHFRRALTSFYLGDQVTWNPHVANMFNNKSLTGHVTLPYIEPDGPVDCDLFPRVWP